MKQWLVGSLIGAVSLLTMMFLFADCKSKVVSLTQRVR